MLFHSTDSNNTLSRVAEYGRTQICSGQVHIGIHWVLYKTVIKCTHNKYK